MSGLEQGAYLQRLKRINYFTRELIELECPTLPNHQPVLRLAIAKELNELSDNGQEPQTPLKSSKMTASRMQRDRKSQLLSQVLSEDEEFVKEYNRDTHGEVTRLIQNSKFARERVNRFTKLVGRVVKRGTRHYRDFFNRLTAEPEEEEEGEGEGEQEGSQGEEKEKGILKNVDGKEVGKKLGKTVAKSVVKKVLFK